MPLPESVSTDRLPFGRVMMLTDLVVPAEPALKGVGVTMVLPFDNVVVSKNWPDLPLFPLTAIVETTTFPLDKGEALMDGVK